MRSLHRRNLHGQFYWLFVISKTVIKIRLNYRKYWTWTSRPPCGLWAVCLPKTDFHRDSCSNSNIVDDGNSDGEV